MKKEQESEKYSTLCFKTVTQAIKNKNKDQIDKHFSIRLISSAIRSGVDERGNSGFYVEYYLSK